MTVCKVSSRGNGILQPRNVEKRSIMCTAPSSITNWHGTQQRMELQELLGISTVYWVILSVRVQHSQVNGETVHPKIQQCTSEEPLASLPQKKRGRSLTRLTYRGITPIFIDRFSCGLNFAQIYLTTKIAKNLSTQKFSLYSSTLTHIDRQPSELHDIGMVSLDGIYTCA